MKSLTPEEVIGRSIQVKGVHGVYFLIDDGEIVYIGKSTNFASRLGVHSLEKKFTRVYFMAIDDASQLDELERFYIKKFDPRLNKTKNWPGSLPALDAPGTRLERTMMRIRAGQPAYSSAKAEGMSPNSLYISRAYRDFKRETN
ncbi:GIY-YIG nuclease family protein [Paraburkholderia sediminicola]|uniref:GIY-YIG nuclease family protein n=1 Tax=Paraburkholderia sediminicola TaxID=458836 RepID=UPI0038BDCF02